MSGFMRDISLPSLNERQPVEIVTPHVTRVLRYTQEDTSADCIIPPDLNIYKSKIILHPFPLRTGFQ